MKNFRTSMTRKILGRAQKGKAPKSTANGKVPVVDISHPENYLSYGYYGNTVGKTGGAVGSSSLCFTDALMNSSTSTGTQLQLGTGVNLRLGKHIFFTRLVVRLRVASNTAARFRLIVARNAQDAVPNTLSTNTATTAFAEGTQILEAPLTTVGGAGVFGPIDYMISPSTDWEILHDQIYGNTVGLGTGTTMSISAGEVTSTNVELDIPLNVQRSYDNNGVPDAGGWFIYMVTDDAATGTSIAGWIRVQYVNQWSFEGIAKGFGNAFSAADKILSSAVRSTALNALARFVPRVFGF
jgi:hypothetical protein